MENLYSDDTVHVYVARLINPPHAALAYLLQDAIFVIEQFSYESVCRGGDKRYAVKRAKEQLVFHLSLADRASLHRRSPVTTGISE
jgi:hypothetical protein